MKEQHWPMLVQYRKVKENLPAAVLLLFKLSDFYELFLDDAREVAPILGVALTQRNGTPMCGVPCHALDTYLRKLVRAGKRVAICEQVDSGQDILKKLCDKKEVTA